MHHPPHPTQKWSSGLCEKRTRGSPTEHIDPGWLGGGKRRQVGAQQKTGDVAADSRRLQPPFHILCFSDSFPIVLGVFLSSSLSPFFFCSE